MVTLKDIAKEAGVSVMTVSRVVNGQLSKVSESNVERIQAIIKKSGYVPNSSARSLSSKSSRIIAVIIQGKETGLEYPYNATMVGNICYYVQEHDYYPMIYYVSDYQDITKRLRSWNVEGAIFLGMFDQHMKNIHEDNRIPLIFTDSYSPVRQITNIGIDDYKGGELAARHFIEKGHRSFAFIGTSANFSSVVRQRLHGFQHVLKEAGLELEPEHIIPDEPDIDTLRAIYNAETPITAFFASADVVALTLIDKLKTLGLRVPEDCSVIGFDNLFFGAYTAPKLTTIMQDIKRKAQIATDILFKHISDPSAPAENVVLDVQLIERESVRSLK